MTKNILILAAAVLGTPIAATPVMAGHIRVEYLAERLVDDLGDLGREFRDDYRFAPEYQTLLATTLEMHRLACQIERLADCKGSLAEIDALVCSLERLQPYLQNAVARVHCHNLCGATRGVTRELKEIAEGICELREETAEMKIELLSRRAPVNHYKVNHQEVIRHDIGHQQGIRHDVGHQDNFGHGHSGGHSQVQFGVQLGRGGPTIGFGSGGFNICFGR